MNKEEIRNKIQVLCKEYIQCVEAENAQKEKKYIPASGKSLGVEELCNMFDASLDMWLTAGRFNDAFEKNFAKKLTVKHALSTNSGSSANLLAITALTSHKLGERALQKGDEVITVAAGFPTTVNPIIQNGLVPVFVDSELDTYNIDVQQIEKSISSKTKAIMIAHTLGNMFEIDAISQLCAKYNLWLIEDSCDALGAKYNNQYAGTIGHIGTFSFYPAHHMTMGEGGALVTNDTTLYRIIMSLRDWGRDCWCLPGTDNSCHKRFSTQHGTMPYGYDHKYIYSHVGYNLKITDWQAAIGVAQLEKLDSFLEQRKKNAETLLDGLADMQEFLVLPTVSPKCIPSWFGFLLRVKEHAPCTKQELIEYLEKNGIGTRQLFAGNMLRQPLMTQSPIALRIHDSPLLMSNALTEKDYALLPNTENIMRNTFWIGVAQNVDEDDMQKSLATIKAFIKSKM